MASKLGSHSTKYELNHDQAQTLATETTLVLLGIIHTDEYETILKTELNLSQESFANMISDINQEIIQNIGNQLNETFQKNIKDLEEKREPSEIDKRFANLSPELQDAISRSDYQNIILEVAKKHALDIPQTGTLGEAVVKVILGEVVPDKFEEILQELNLPKETSRQIVEELNEKIFKAIRTKLQENTSASPTPKIGEQPSQILNQKFSGTFTLPKVETDHSLPNVTKSDEKSTSPTKTDPYREPVE